jgi:hypothetical protein
MSTTSDIDRKFAVMLAELEDTATELTARLSTLHKEAEAVEAELQRVEGVRTAMLGRPARRKPGPKPSTKPGTTRERKSTAAADRVERIREYARANGGTFTGREVADEIGMAFQGVGPVLAGMVRRGEATVEEPDEGPRVYTLVEA